MLKHVGGDAVTVEPVAGIGLRRARRKDAVLEAPAGSRRLIRRRRRIGEWRVARQQHAAKLRQVSQLWQQRLR
eukprot:70853-Chlamydomonas_euryale.AAC.5